MSLGNKKYWKSIDDHRKKLMRGHVESIFKKIPIGAPKGNVYLGPSEYASIKEDIVDGKYEGHRVVKLPPREWKPRKPSSY